MRRAFFWFAALFSCLFLFSGCTSSPPESSPGGTSPEAWGNIPFLDGQLYAVAHLGYQEMTELEHYTEQYLGGIQVPVHYFSSGDYYLVIPRYSGMSLSLYQNDIETSASTLVYEDHDCQPFVLQCNASDIFPDATIRLVHRDQTAEFSPFLSLKDGSLDIGPYGLDLTEKTVSGS